MTLKETIPFMTSESYGDRLLAEYWQAKNRYDSLSALLDDKEGEYTKLPEDVIPLMEKQKLCMETYIDLLKARIVASGWSTEPKTMEEQIAYYQGLFRACHSDLLSAMRGDPGTRCRFCAWLDDHDECTYEGSTCKPVWKGLMEE